VTLVVARNEKGRIAIAADTRVTEHDSPLPIQRGTIKSCMLPGDVCVSFSNSPVTAEHAFKMFISKYPNGTGYSDVMSFFEQSSAQTGNDYLIAFSRNPRIEKVVDGKRVHSIAKTVWIGDKSAYERFREYDAKRRPNIEHPHAMNAVYFADELKNSPASDLYSTMRNIVADHSIPSVGGFVSVVHNRDNGFRFSVYSDMLFDWPREKTEEYLTNLNDPITLESSGENLRYSVAQISPGYMSMNLVAFYYVKGKILYLFYGEMDNNYYGLASKCHVTNGVEPNELQEKLTQVIDAKWLLTVTSGVPTSEANYGPLKPDQGMRLSFIVEANSFPRPPESPAR
jgi:hypothetical protein